MAACPRGGWGDASQFAFLIERRGRHPTQAGPSLHSPDMTAGAGHPQLGAVGSCTTTTLSVG